MHKVAARSNAGLTRPWDNNVTTLTHSCIILKKSGTSWREAGRARLCNSDNKVLESGYRPRHAPAGCAPGWRMPLGSQAAVPVLADMRQLQSPAALHP